MKLMHLYTSPWGKLWCIVRNNTEVYPYAYKKKKIAMDQAVAIQNSEDVQFVPRKTAQWRPVPPHRSVFTCL